MSAYHMAPIVGRALLKVGGHPSFAVIYVVQLLSTNKMYQGLIESISVVEVSNVGFVNIKWAFEYKKKDFFLFSSCELVTDNAIPLFI